MGELIDSSNPELFVTDQEIEHIMSMPQAEALILHEKYIAAHVIGVDALRQNLQARKLLVARQDKTNVILNLLDERLEEIADTNVDITP